MRALLPRLTSLVLPPRCPGCGAVTEADHRFCVRCWESLTFLGPPWCAGCALPFGYDRGPGALCGACLDERPSHSGARAAVAYGPVARTVALRLKYGGRTAFADTAAKLMYRLVPDDAALLIPIPLHRWRLWARGYNQAALIAAALERMGGPPVARDLLRRTRATPVLRGLNPRQRRQAVAGAFTLAGGGREQVRGKHILLVDDVYTSGATAAACAKLLTRAGAARVTVLCWARVIGEDAD